MAIKPLWISYRGIAMRNYFLFLALIFLSFDLFASNLIFTTGHTSGVAAQSAVCVAAGKTSPGYASASGPVGSTSGTITFQCWHVSTWYSGFSVSGSCPNGQKITAWNGDGWNCAAPVVCPIAGTFHSKGFFNVGLDPRGQLLQSPCSGGCRQTLKSGVVPAASQIINGKKYFFGQAEYIHTGENCSPDTPNFLADFVGQMPAASCAPGQQSITMGGVTKCFAGGQEVSTAAASAVQSTKTAEELKDLQKNIEAQTKAINAVSSVGGTESEKSMARSIASGIKAAGDVSDDESMDTNNDGAISDDEILDDLFCRLNPSALSCLEKDFGKVEEEKLTEKEVNVSGISPVSVGGGGGCPSDKSFTVAGKTYMMNYGLFCDFASGLRPLFLAMAWLSAAGILIGGFKTGG